MTKLEKFKRMMLSEDMHVKLTLGLLITMGLTLIGGSFAAAAIYTNMQRDIIENREKVVENKNSIHLNTNLISDNKEEIQRQEVIQAQINTRLANIETRQLEMIEMLKDR